MSKLFVVSVFDSALDAFGRPFFVPTTQAAVRGFTDEVNRRSEDNPMWRHPEDYVLHLLGVFDDAEGRFENVDQRTMLVRAKDVIASQQ